MSSASEPSEPGDLSSEELRRRGYSAIDWIVELLASSRDLPVLARTRPGDLLAALPLQGPEEPQDWEQTLADLNDLILPGITHWNHPRFFAYFANTGSVPGIIGATLATALNPNSMLWRTSPAATELEQRVLEWLAGWLGLPTSLFGIINDTASVSTLCALAAARQLVPGYSSQEGMGSLAAPLRLYASEQAHSSIDKAALLLGLGTASVRKIPTRADYSMDPHALEAAIVSDLAAGEIPFCVVATAGTTSTTSIDPLEKIATLCARFDLWLHVDAAYGGAAAVVPDMRPRFRGWERADSIVVNPHKWLFTPMCCSVLYTRRPDDLRAAFSLVPEYLRSDVGDDRSEAQGDDADGLGAAPIDFMNYGIQLGRPFRALKLWMVMNAYGRAGIEQRLRHHMELAARFASWVDEHPDFERLAPTPLSTVCFRYRPGAGRGTGDGTDLAPVPQDPHAAANEELMARVNRGGQIFLSHTRLRGRLALRLAIGNLRTTAADVQHAWQTLLDTRPPVATRGTGGVAS